MELWKEVRTGILDFREIYIQTTETIRSIKIANHEEMCMRGRLLGITYTYEARGKETRKSQKRNPKKRKVLFVNIRKRLFLYELAWIWEEGDFGFVFYFCPQN